VDPKRRRLAATWPEVRERLPQAPADVVEIGCGPLGGFVPWLREAGYAAVGVDPEAPSEPSFRSIRFEEYEPPGSVDAVVAGTSLHHVDDLAEVLDRVADALRPGRVVIVIEWDWQRFDEATARWCFARLRPPADDDEASWLHRHKEGWASSGRSWPEYWRGWIEEEGLHAGRDIVRALDQRFDRQACEYGPYFFPDLEATKAEEAEAITAGVVQATGFTWVGNRR